MNKQQLANKIWETANKMRSKIEANEYKDYILGFIFYKFLSQKEEKYFKELGMTDEEIAQDANYENQGLVEDVKTIIGYFIPHKYLFSTWLRSQTSGKIDYTVEDVVTALGAFDVNIDKSREQIFKGIFSDLLTGISKLGDNAKAQTRAISDLINLINEIPMDGKQDYDVLGFIYEYLISNFAANAGKKAGEFYTPHEVSLLMSEIVAEHLKDRKEIKKDDSTSEDDTLKIYDPTSGSGSLLINIGKAVARHNGNSESIKYYAQELKQNTYNLTRMNLVMRDINPSNIQTRNADTLQDDWPLYEKGQVNEPLYVDAVVSNPPYSQHWNPEHKDVDPRYADYGLAPAGKADYAFLLHDLYHIRPDGIMTIVLPHGVLFRGGEEGQIRKRLVDKNQIDAIIGLPANIFFGTGIPTIIMVLKKNRNEADHRVEDVLIIDASKGFEKAGKSNRLRASDIRKIVDVVTTRRNVPKFSRAVPLAEIRANDYNLNIPRYVDSSERPESWDIHAAMFGGIPAGEIALLDEYWSAFPHLKDALFEQLNEESAKLRTSDVKKTVTEHPDVKEFLSSVDKAFEGFDEYLRRELIAPLKTLKNDDSGLLAREEATLSDDVFRRYKGIPLVDEYVAYQILDDNWKKIASDLEVIQSEGFDVTRVVDPKMIPKKDSQGKFDEVQNGWLGRILPFSLVQRIKLADRLEAIKALDDRRSAISASYDEALDSLSESEEETKPDFLNEDKSAFVWPEVKKALKEKTSELDPKTLELLKRVSKENDEDKKLGKELKALYVDLEKSTKAVIEGLSDDEVVELLHEKWIVPLVAGLAGVPEAIIADFTKTLEKLVSKYETTLHDVEEEIKRTEKELADMIGSLTGSDHDMKGLNELRRMLGGL